MRGLSRARTHRVRDARDLFMLRNNFLKFNFGAMPTALICVGAFLVLDLIAKLATECG